MIPYLYQQSLANHLAWFKTLVVPLTLSHPCNFHDTIATYQHFPSIRQYRRRPHVYLSQVLGQQWHQDTHSVIPYDMVGWIGVNQLASWKIVPLFIIWIKWANLVNQKNTTNTTFSWHWVHGNPTMKSKDTNCHFLLEIKGCTKAKIKDNFIIEFETNTWSSTSLSIHGHQY